jgi:hypothetical protein
MRKTRLYILLSESNMQYDIRNTHPPRPKTKPQRTMNHEQKKACREILSTQPYFKRVMLFPKKVSQPFFTAAWAAASLAMGTLNGEQDT